MILLFLGCAGRVMEFQAMTASLFRGYDVKVNHFFRSDNTLRGIRHEEDRGNRVNIYYFKM